MERRFLIIDDNRDERSLLSRALVGHYPAAPAQEYRDFESAREVLAGLVSEEDQTVVLVHRTQKMEGADLVRCIRKANSRIPIIALGEARAAEEVLAAGATRFLPYEAWLRLGRLVKGL